jgi:DNA-binding XRE family transcriptional regulator
MVLIDPPSRKDDFAAVRRRLLRRKKTTVTVVGMEATQKSDASAPGSDGADIRIRLEVYDALAQAKGAKTVVAQAEMHGVHRATLFRIRNGERLPSLELAIRMASDLGTTVEALFERRAA